MKVIDYEDRIDKEPQEVILCDSCGRECNTFHNGIYLTCDSIDGKDYCSDCLKMMFVQGEVSGD